VRVAGSAPHTAPRPRSCERRPAARRRWKEATFPLSSPPPRTAPQPLSIHLLTAALSAALTTTARRATRGRPAAAGRCCDGREEKRKKSGSTGFRVAPRALAARRSLLALSLLPARAPAFPALSMRPPRAKHAPHAPERSWTRARKP